MGLRGGVTIHGYGDEVDYGFLMSAFLIGIKDILMTFTKVPLAASMAYDDIALRFQRTFLGPLWIPVSNLIMIAGLTYVFGAIFQADIKSYIVYLAAGLMVWSFISGILISGPNFFVRSQDILESFSLPWSLQVMRFLMGHLFILVIHGLIFIILALIVELPITGGTALALLGLLILIVSGYGISLVLASIGIKYRDLQHAIESVMTFLFLLTPIFWRSADLPMDRPSVTELNPLYHMIEIVRAPLLGMEVGINSWLVSITIAGTSLIVGAAVFASNRSRLLLWL